MRVICVCIFRLLISKILFYSISVMNMIGTTFGLWDYCLNRFKKDDNFVGLDNYN